MRKCGYFDVNLVYTPFDHTSLQPLSANEDVDCDPSFPYQEIGGSIF
jgi:hypothetical protein